MTDGSPRHASKPTTGPALVAGLLGSLVAVVLFSSTGHDDCHITFWSAWSLAELGEIVNHSGERVEQSSSLLHTLLLAGLYGVTGVALPWLAYLLGIAAAITTVVRLPALARACGWTPGFGGLLLLATTPGFAYWQLGMLESSLFTLAGVEFVLRLTRLVGPDPARGVGAWTGVVLWSGALAAVRPEAGLVAICVAGATLLTTLRGAPTAGAARAAAGVLAVAVLWSAALVLFRRAYFGPSFPQPVAAKVGGGGLSLYEVGVGLGYLVERFASASGAVLLAGLLCGLALGWRDLRARRLHRVVPLWFVGAYTSFLVLAGGDWMMGWRFVAHVEPLFVFLLLQALAAVDLGAGLRRATLALLLAANAVGLVGLAAVFGTGLPLWTAYQVDPAVRAFAPGEITWPERANQVHARDVVMVDELNEVLGKVLEHRDSVSVLSKQGGLLMFHAAREYFGRLEFYDRLGLVSTHYDEIKREFEIPTGQFGLTWTLYDVFWLAKTRDDAILHPDVIFDIHENAIPFVAERGYVVVYEQHGTIGSEYLTPQEVLHGSEDAERIRFDPDVSKEERRAERRERAEENKNQRFRERMRLRLPESRTLWRSKTPMVQFVAVREDLAWEAGLVGVDEVRELTDDAPATRHHLDWDEARKPYLAYVFGEREPAVGPPPETLVRIVPFTARATATRDGRQRLVLDPADEIPAALLARHVLVDGRELTEENQFTIRRNGTEAPQVVLFDPSGARPGSALEVRGYTTGDRRYEVLAEVAGANDPE